MTGMLLLAAGLATLSPIQESLTPDPTWSPRSASGSARAFHLDSEILSERRRVFVSLPPSHDRVDRDYPLIIVLDGESVSGPIIEAAAALARAGHAPEAVIVGVENTNRLRDLSPPGLDVSGNQGSGRADLFTRFLVEELRPAMDAAFRAAGPVVLVGHSSGGLFAHYALVEAPDPFASILSLDAPMHLEEGALAERIRTEEGLATTPVRLVSVEARFGWRDADWNALRERAADGWQLRRERLDGESHNSMVWPGSYRGLRALFDDYSTVGSSDASAVDRLGEIDASVWAEAGVPPPQPLLVEAAEDLLESLDLERAEGTIRRLAAAYGESGTVADLQGRLEAARSESLEGPTAAEMQATPFASADAAAPLVGEWRTCGGAQGPPVTMSVRIVDGRPGGEIRVGEAPPMEIEYLTANGATFHVGYMNRMRPRGMLVYEGVVRGDVFEGDFHLRGVVFRLPDGRPVPVTPFCFER